MERLDIKRMAASQINEKDLRAKAYEVIHHIIRDVRDRLPPGIEPEALVKEVYDEALGLGRSRTCWTIGRHRDHGQRPRPGLRRDARASWS